MDAVTQEHKPFYDSMVPDLVPVRPPQEMLTDEELDREIFLLEREILRELEETASLHADIEEKIAAKADKKNINCAIIER